MRRGRKPSEIYVAMLSELRMAYEKGDGALPFEKKFSDWAYDFNATRGKIKSYQFAVRMELAKEDIPIVPVFSQSRGGRRYIDGLKVTARNEHGFAEVEGDDMRDMKAMKGKLVNTIIRKTARVNSKMLPPARRNQHKRLIGRQAEQFVRLLEETVQSGQRNQE